MCREISKSELVRVLRAELYRMGEEEAHAEDVDVKSGGFFSSLGLL